MKRALLIAGGTVGGLGAVLLITPPQLNSQGMAGLSGIASSVTSNAGTAANTTTMPVTTDAVPQAATTATAAATPASSATKATTQKTATKVTTKKVVTKKTPSAKVASTTTTTKNNSSTLATTSTPTPSSTPTKTVTPTPTPTKTVTPTPASKGVSGSFAGTSVDVGYGTVQVQITVVNGKITEVQALQAPSGRNGRFTQYALPILKQETLAAQSAQIQSVSGASYTSWGWYTSLQAALAKAGM